MPERDTSRHLTEDVLRALLRSLAAQRAESLDRHFQTIQAATIAFAGEHSRFFAELSADMPGPDAEFATAPNGSVYQTNVKEGSSFFIPRSSVGKMRAEDWLFAKKSLALNPAYRLAKNSKPDVVAAYINTDDPADMNRYYPFIEKPWETYPPDLDMRNFSFYYLADEEHNPERRAVWTSIYPDPAGMGWMLSCIAPVYVANTLKGVVGLDVTVDTLDRIVQWKLPWGASPLLISAAGTVLAATDKARGELRLGASRPFIYTQPIDKDETDPSHLRLSSIPDPVLRSELLEFIKSDETLIRANSADSDLFVAKSRVPATGWNFLLVVPREALLGELDKLEESEVRLQAELRSKEAELAYKIGQYNAARGFMHDLRNAITRLEIPVIRLNRKKREIEKLAAATFEDAMGALFANQTALRKLENALTGASFSGPENSLGVPADLNLVETLQQAVASIEDVKGLIRHATAYMEEGLIGAVRDVPADIELCALLRHLVAEAQIGYPKIQADLPDSVVVRGSRPIIKAGLDNVIRNAIEASSLPNPSGGPILVTCTNLKDGALVTVRDSGIGIAADALPHVTEMGFTTKGEKGHGLGLHFFSVSLSAAGGELTVQSDGVGKGAAVEVRIKNVC